MCFFDTILIMKVFRLSIWSLRMSWLVLNKIYLFCDLENFAKQLTWASCKFSLPLGFIFHGDIWCKYIFNQWLTRSHLPPVNVLLYSLKFIYSRVYILKCIWNKKNRQLRHSMPMTLDYNCIKCLCTETEMCSFWRKFRHWLHRKLSNDNFRCSLWLKFRQNDIFVSMWYSV